MLEKIIHTKITDAPAEHENDHAGYEYYKRALVPLGLAEQCVVAAYEIPPGKAAYPYHYHTQKEESFFILRGKGLLKTPAGGKTVEAGDFLFFPANETGAHKLTNTSETEMLVYLDFDTRNKIDAAVYPDSGKIGVWGGGINQVFRTAQQVELHPIS